MRVLFLAVLAIALAVPAVAVADRGSSHSLRSTVVVKKAKAKKAAKHRRARIAVRIRIVRPQPVVAIGDERELRGRITSLAPLTVGTLTCSVPAGVSLAGFAVGDLVEITCDRVGGVFVLRKLRHEDEDEAVDDEREVTGLITSLAPLTVGGLTCSVPAGVSLAGFAVGDLVEITCDLVGGQLVLRKLHLEDDDEAREDDHRGPGAGVEDEHDHSGPGHGGSDDGDHSGHGGGGDD